MITYDSTFDLYKLKIYWDVFIQNGVLKEEKLFHLSVEKEYEFRIKQLFTMVGEDQILSFSLAATWEIVRDNPRLQGRWNWDDLSQNPRVATWEIVRDNPDKPWNWNGLSKNLYREIEIEYGRKYMGAYLIQNRWRNISVDETHPLGRNVIMGRMIRDYL